MSKGRAARRVSAGWRPAVTLDEEALIYRARVEGSDTPLAVDASDWGTPHQFTVELLRSIRTLVEAEGAWQRRATIAKNVSMVQNFAQWVGRWDDPNVAATSQPQRIAELTAGMWSAYVLSVTKPGRQTHKRILLQVAQVLNTSGLLTDEAEARVLAPKGKPETQEVEHYTDEEFRALVSASKRVVREAHARIRANYAAAMSSDGESAGSREAILRAMLTDPVPRRKAEARLVGALKETEYFSSERQRMVLGGKIQKQDARRALYPDASEGFAAMVLLACLKGLNLSQIENFPMPDRSVDSAHEFAQVLTDKPRSGPSRRFSLEVFDETDDDSDGRWLRRVEEMTDPIRMHARTIGQPIDDALIAYFGATGTLTRRTPSSVDRSHMPWLQNLPVVDFRRIKRTYETRHRREATQNSEAMHIVGYLLKDPDRVAEFQERAINGIERGYQRALSAVQLRMVSPDSPSLSGAEDSAFASCTDPDHEPRTGLPCRDGFLGCLSCPNAIATSRHLPLMRYTLHLLDELRGVLPDAQWSDRFADAFVQLSHVVSTAPSPPVERRITGAQKAIIRAALGLPGERP